MPQRIAILEGYGLPRRYADPGAAPVARRSRRVKAKRTRSHKAGHSLTGRSKGAWRHEFGSCVRKCKGTGRYRRCMSECLEKLGSKRHRVRRVR